MRPLGNENPGQGRTGAGVNRQFGLNEYSRFSEKYQVLPRLLFLESLIPADGYFEPELSLRIDAAHVALEEMPRGGPAHISVVVREVMADLARQRGTG
jgi:hypothetical protein